MQYMLIHRVDESADSTPEQDAEVEASLASWVEHTIRDGVSLHGSRLRPTRDGAMVRVRDDELLVSDGPFAETKEQVGGYDLIECADLDQAIEVASRHPTARLGTIEVRPVWEP
jgi:hypothetical protein